MCHVCVYMAYYGERCSARSNPEMAIHYVNNYKYCTYQVFDGLSQKYDTFPRYDFNSNSNFELVFVSRISQIRLKKSVTEIL